jgi:two-component system cell cycle response regulator
MAKKILVVEDDSVLRDVLIDKLGQAGYETRPALDGIEAMDLIREDHPSLVLLDILMPRKGGMEVLEEMQADPELSKIPVIIISNSGQPVEIKRARELGAQDFLIKAVFDPSEVLDKVDRVLKEQSVDPDNYDTAVDDPNEQVVELDAMPKAGAVHDGNEKGNILIVEDDEFLRGLFIRKMTTEGLTVTGAGDANEAFTFLAENKPDIILLDLMLPGIDGYEILSRLKSVDDTKDIPVMVISNLGQKAEIDRAMDLGAHDFLVKSSLTLDEIVERVLAVIHGG